MKEIISIANHKGGVGKTSTAHALGAGLMQKGYKTLFIDLDAQGNLSFCLGADPAPLTTLEVLTGTVTAEDAIQHTEGGDIIPASPALAGAEQLITGTGKEYRLAEALEPLHSLYDYIIIDCPPMLGTLTINALTASTGTIIPVQADTFSIQGIGLLNDTITAVRKYTNPALKIKGILITRYNGRAILSKDMKEGLEQVAEHLGTELYKTQIRECIAVKEAQASQKDIYSYSPKSNASQDYTAFIEELFRV